MLERPPLSLYVHLPWCIRKCPYCDFNSHVAGAAAPTGRYLRALIADLRMESGKALGRPLESIFIGGGTPSLFSAREIGALLEAIADGFSMSPGVEITMEANPGTVERHRLGEYRRAGVNRLSLGAQNFDAGFLARLGRIHGPDETVAAYTEARDAGFESINLDLMYALPGQDLAQAVGDVERAIALAPDHVSWYQLTLEPNTVFHARPPADLPGDDLAFEMQEHGQQLLGEAGFEQYEVSAFAKPGHRCRHNLNYWTFGDYLGVGAGAHGKVTDRRGDVRRQARPAHPASYMDQAEAGRFDRPPRLLGPADLRFEFMLNALRLPDGFSEEAFSSRTGLPFITVERDIRNAESRGLIESPGPGGWRPTVLGLRFLNDLQARFLPLDKPRTDQQLSNA